MIDDDVWYHVLSRSKGYGSTGLEVAALMSLVQFFRFHVFARKQLAREGDTVSIYFTKAVH